MKKRALIYRFGLCLWVASLLVPSPGGASTAPHGSVQSPPERWAGIMMVRGTKSVFLLGELETKTVSYVLADVQRDNAGVRLVQSSCHVDIQGAAGVTPRMSTNSARRVPASSIELVRSSGGFDEATWVSGWNDADHDADGSPGVTIEVDAPLCGGEIYVASTTTTRARPRPWRDTLEAELEVTVEQRILDTSNVCLDASASDSVEKLTGFVRYVRVPPNAQCDTYSPEKWPVSLPR